MEDDDTYLVIVGDSDGATQPSPIVVKEEPKDESDAGLALEKILQTAEKHGQYIEVHIEPHCEHEYLEEENVNKAKTPESSEEYTPDADDEDYIPDVGDEDYVPDVGDEDSKPYDGDEDYAPYDGDQDHEPDDGDEDYKPDDCDEDYLLADGDGDYLLDDDDEDCVSEALTGRSDDEYGVKSKSKLKKQKFKKRWTMLKPEQWRSFVADLRDKYPELRKKEELLVQTLCEIMRSVKAPDPPKDYFIMNGPSYECIHCPHMSETKPAANRHYNEKHGPRYLVCFACGVDFRSRTNLYKHEKRCAAPDAKVVLKARARRLGNKGRSRPYIELGRAQPPAPYKPKVTKFPCSRCSASFVTRKNLISHENLHNGEKPHQCYACPAAYTSSSALSRHEKTHSNVQYICDHCARSFKIKAALVAHMDTHKPYRKHGCNECGKRYAQKAALQLHVNKVHKKLPPPFACNVCEKRFPRMPILKKHMENEHGLLIMTRKMFFRKLPAMSDLELKTAAKIIFKSDVEAQGYINEDELKEYEMKVIKQELIEEEEITEEETSEEEKFDIEIIDEEIIRGKMIKKENTAVAKEIVHKKGSFGNKGVVEKKGKGCKIKQKHVTDNSTMDEFVKYLKLEGKISEKCAKVLIVHNGQILNTMESEEELKQMLLSEMEKKLIGKI